VIKIIDMELNRPSSLQLSSRSHLKARILLPRKSLRSGSDSRRMHNSFDKQRHSNNFRNPEEPLDIFFNQHKRKSYLRDVVDNYFVPQHQKIAPILSNNNFLCSSTSFTREDPSLSKSPTFFSNRGVSNGIDSKSKLSLFKLSTFC